MKVLVVGHRGTLGRELLFRPWPPGWSVVGRGRPELDITQAASLRRTLEAVGPEVLINAAAYTAVDKAETEPASAFAVNRDGAACLATACYQAGIPFIHVSTDYVFDGHATRPYGEEAPAAPLGIYGRSKWEGEMAVRLSHREHLIVRTAWLYGHYGPNFVRTMLRLARERDVLRVVADQHGCPTWSQDLAEALVALCQCIGQDRHAISWGTYHFCGAGQTTWHGLAQAAVAIAGGFEPLRVRAVEAIPTAAYPTPARRPAYTVLDCCKIQRAFGVTPRPWQESLREFVQEMYTCPAILPVGS